MRSRTLLLIAATAALPLAAQTPLFTDGTAFGGSKVFSEGLNPLGNTARSDRAAPGTYLTWVQGDERAKDNDDLLRDLAAADAVRNAVALKGLGKAPWAIRTRAFGLAGVKDAAVFSLTREEQNTLDARPEGDAARADLVRNVVDRISLGGGSLQSGTAFGMGLRLERWTHGRRQLTLPAGEPFPAADPDLLDGKDTQAKTLTYGMDAGFTTELSQGLRVGLNVDQLNPKRLWDVYLRPQFRAGLQIDLGAAASLTLESDLNATPRMPFPEKQRTSAASLRFQAGPAATLVVGAERRKVGDADPVTRFGATLQMRTAALMLGVGFQVAPHQGLRGATFKM